VDTDVGTGHGRWLLAGALGLALAGASLAGCTTSATESPRPAVASARTQDGSTASSTKKPSETLVDISLPMNWVTDGMRRDGDGYALTMVASSRPGVYDAYFFHQAKDGAVSGQQFMTVRVTGRDSLKVTWPDGTIATGALSLAADGSPQTEIALDPGCLPFLEPGRSQLDCRFYPKAEEAPKADPSGVPSSAAMAPLPGTDEAMGYLCSVGVDELARVTARDSDPYDTTVLQTALGLLGYQSGPIDGVYGKQAREAVLAYQADASLVVDGLVGPKTWASLQADACRVAQDPAQ
jgi:hypothetical protein